MLTLHLRDAIFAAHMNNCFHSGTSRKDEHKALRHSTKTVEKRNHTIHILPPALMNTSSYQQNKNDHRLRFLGMS